MSSIPSCKVISGGSWMLFKVNYSYLYLPDCNNLIVISKSFMYKQFVKFVIADLHTVQLVDND